MRSTKHAPRAPWLRVCRLLIFAVACAAAQSATATPRVEIKQVQVGFANVFKVGHWTPVNVTLTAKETISGRLELVTPDADDAPVITTREIELSGGEQTVFHYTKFGSTETYLIVRFAPAGGGEVTTRRFGPEQLPRGLASRTRLLVSIGADLGIEETRGTFPADGPDLVTVLVPDPAPLPEWRACYGGVDVVYLAGDSLDLSSSTTLRKLGVIERWASLGGHVMLSLGGSAETWRRAADRLGPESSLARLIAGVGPALERRGARIVFAGDSAAIGATISGVKLLDFTAPDLAPSAFRTRATLYDDAGQRPFVTQRAHGLGIVTIVAGDLERAPLADWKSRQQFLSRLLAALWPARERPLGRGGGKVSHAGYRDLTGLLHVRLDSFPGASLTPFSLVALAMAVYLVLLGPVDYWLTGRRGPSWRAWAVFALLLVTASALAGWWAHAAKSHKLAEHRVDLVDIEAATGLTRGTCWAHIYTPGARRLEFSLQVDPRLGEVEEAVVSWAGMPGKGFTGMDSRYSPLALALATAYRIETDSTEGAGNDRRPAPRRLSISGAVPGPHSSKGFQGSWSSRGKRTKAEPLRRLPRGLGGRIENVSPFILRDCLLLYEGRAYRVGELRPGEIVEVKSLGLPRDIGSILRETLLDDFGGGQGGDLSKLDAASVVGLVGFYQAAGGPTYSELENNYHAHLDWSRRLELGRAVLLGRADSAATRSQPGMAAKTIQPATIVRIAYPVIAGEPESM